MNAVLLPLLAMVIYATPSFGGEIYGTIREGERPVGKGVTLEIRSSAQAYQGVTDDFGNYRVVVPETGKCTITVQFKGQSISGEIQSYWSPVRFDWVLEKTGEKYSLKRQ
jgi:hypothetical protein